MVSERKPVGWIVTSEFGVYCCDKRWRRKAEGIESIKVYKTLGGVRRGMRRWWAVEWEALALYEGYELDCCGNVRVVQEWERECTQERNQ